MTFQLDKKQKVKEILKCGKDPAYFLKTYARISHPMHGLILFDTYAFHDDLLQDFNDYRFNVILKAALDLGASHVQTFRKILLPFLRPAIGSACVLGFLRPKEEPPDFEAELASVSRLAHQNRYAEFYPATELVRQLAEDDIQRGQLHLLVARIRAAQLQLDQMSDDDIAVGPIRFTRQQWQQWFDWIGSAGLW